VITNKEQLGNSPIYIYHNFLTPERCLEYINFFESNSHLWSETPSHGVYGMGFALPLQFNNDIPVVRSDLDFIVNTFTEITSEAHKTPVQLNELHAARWLTGSAGDYHADDSDLDGNDNGGTHNVFSTILYLNNDYHGGEVYFKNQDISLKLNPGTILTFKGDLNNVHKINEVLSGTRYNIISFFNIKENKQYGTI
jgi:hypothetical protein